MSDFQVYKGSGLLKPFDGEDLTKQPQDYIPSKGLVNAVNVAISLGQPLLLTGEPGTGKSHLAYSVAHELEMGDPLIFRTKTTSVSRDLFYVYDALSHFRAVQADKNANINSYIRMGPLGQAIRSNERRVVLIDEIDKAPRDLPNDMLNEIESLSFEIPETGELFQANRENRPVVIMTSNSEKNLPDAFLRRCIFYHMPFPDADELSAILKARLKSDYFSPEDVDHLIKQFLKFRKLLKRKQPSTAELLSWIKILERMNFKNTASMSDFSKLSESEKDILLTSYSILAKTKEDYLDLQRQIASAG